MKRIGWSIALVAVLGISWYLFIRAHEFEVNFTARTSPGDIIQSLRIWTKSVDGARIVAVDSLDNLVQEIQKNGRSYVYSWYFTPVNDSTTKVRVLVSEPGSETQNKMLVLVSQPAIERDASDLVNAFYRILQAHLQITKVEVLGLSETRSVFCACRSITTAQTDKAYGMMRDYDILTSFVSNHHLTADGPPLLRVSKWSHTQGELSFDFCFPIKKPVALPMTNSLQFKEFRKQKALKAHYFGNYITSDRAWYALTSAARKGGYRIAGLPIEYFYHNPNLGLNEVNWKAEVYLPVE